MSHLIDHARTELERSGQFGEDPAFAQSLLCAVAAFAAFDGHSGVSVHAARRMLDDLLQLRPLSPLTNDPAEWHPHEDRLWQNRRDGAAFSTDHGATYSYVDDRQPSGRHMTVDVLTAPAAAAAAAPVDQCPADPGPVRYPDDEAVEECDACESSGRNCHRHRTIGYRDDGEAIKG